MCVLFSLFTGASGMGRGGRGPRWKMVWKAKTKNALRGMGDTGEARRAGGRAGQLLREAQPTQRRKLRKAQLSTTESKEKTGADSKGEKDLDFRYESHITRDRSSQHGDHRGSSWLLSPLSELTRAIVHVLCICWAPSAGFIVLQVFTQIRISYLLLFSWVRWRNQVILAQEGAPPSIPSGGQVGHKLPSNTPHRVPWEGKLWRGEEGGWAPSLWQMLILALQKAASTLGSHQPPCSLPLQLDFGRPPLPRSHPHPWNTHTDWYQVRGPGLPGPFGFGWLKNTQAQKKHSFSLQHTSLVTYTGQFHQRQKHPHLPRSTLFHAKTIKHTPKQQIFTKSWTAIFPELWGEQPWGRRPDFLPWPQHWLQTLSQLSSWPEMPSCFSAQVPRQACIAEDQGRLEQAWALEQRAVEDSPAWAENSKNRWGHWVSFPYCCEGCICKAPYPDGQDSRPPVLRPESWPTSAISVHLHNNPASGDYFAFYRPKVPWTIPPGSHRLKFKLTPVFFPLLCLPKQMGPLSSIWKAF